MVKKIMGKQVGLMTWYQYENYGSVLQATALYYTVQKLGFQPKMIQYVPRGNREVVPSNIISYYIMKVINKLRNYPNIIYTSTEKSKLFSEFSKKIFTETTCVKTFPELAGLNDVFDVFICGSDQIWSPLCFDENYFFPFVEVERKLISYAPSLGISKIENLYIEKKMKKLATRFAYLSCREEQGVQILRSLTGKKVEHVLDPTLLLNKEEWEILTGQDKNKKSIKEAYILCYFLGNPHTYDSFVQQLSEKLQLPFYVIPQYTWQKKEKHAVSFEIGPSEFLELLKNASFVCTDSFHGTIFSLNFNIPFYALRRFKANEPKNQNSRLESVLKKTSMYNRLVDYKNDIDEKEILNIDFTEANEVLENEKKHSLNYLRNALNHAVLDNSANTRNIDFFEITKLCCGCGACAAICPTKAVQISTDSNGFEHYSINHSLCIQCKACKSVCPFCDINAPALHFSKGMYSYQSNDICATMQSSSGGIGFDLAKIALQQGYEVCGCIYDTKQQRAKHIIINQDKKLTLLQGSKYIQSISSTAIKDLLSKCNEKDDYEALFFGTPCEAAGVDKLFRKKGLRDKIIIVDLICHGVPTNLLWKKYLKDICQTYGLGNSPQVMFRGNHGKWVPLNMTIRHVSGAKVYEKNERQDDFYAFFRRSLCYMESCYECPYRERSAADIRIGDYWGPKFSSQVHGVSMVIANTLIGKQCIEEWDLPAKITRQDLKEYWTIQYPYNHSKPFVYDELMDDLKNSEDSIGQLRKKYCFFYDVSEKIAEIKKIVKAVIK